MAEWTTIESDPGVFTELIQGLGVQGVQVEELYDLNAESLQELKPIYGLIFLFKWTPEKDNRPVMDYYDLFFAKQTITNACATQAILSILMNVPNLDLGPALSEFKEFTKDFNAELKGIAIGNSEVIKKVHNSFSRPEPIAITADDDSKEDAFHFISYVPVNGVLYELDGLKNGPIHLGECTEDNWLDKARAVIQQRIDKYKDNEIRFCLMAVIKDRKLVYTEELNRLHNEKKKLLESIRQGSGIDKMEVEGEEVDVSTLPDEYKEKFLTINSQIEKYNELLKQHEAKLQNWKTENIRRRHNYIPFIFHLLKVLGEKGHLLPLLEKAKEKAKQRAERKQKEKESAKK
jgi:ubiquitin carboxyl-terminal hydrolase L5